LTNHADAWYYAADRRHGDGAGLGEVTVVTPARHKVISRAEAREAGLSRYFTNTKCPQRHRSERIVSNCACVACLRLQRKMHPPPSRQPKTNKRKPHG
jgi:hypothetical protein